MRLVGRVRTSLGLAAVLLLLANGLGCSGMDVNRDTTALVVCTVPLCTSTAKTLTLTQGQARQVFATAQYGNGTSKNVTDNSMWLSSDQNCAAVGTASGLVTGAPSVPQACTANITASFGSVTSSTTTVTVTPGILQTVEVTPSSLTPKGGSTMTFTATGTYSGMSETQDITSLVTWRTDNTGILTFDPGTGNAVVAPTPGQIVHVSAAFIGINSNTVTITVQ